MFSIFWCKYNWLDLVLPCFRSSGLRGCQHVSHEHHFHCDLQLRTHSSTFCEIHNLTLHVERHWITTAPFNTHAHVLWNTLDNQKRLNKIQSCALSQLCSFTRSLALSHAVTNISTLFNPSWDVLWQTVEGNRGQVAHSHNTSVWPHSSKEGRLGAPRQAFSQANTDWPRGKSASQWMDDLHKGSQTVETAGAVSRWVGKSIGTILHGPSSNANVSLASYLWCCIYVQTLLN